MNEVIDFINNHKDYYPEYFIKNRLSKCKYGYTCDVDQIYCHLNKIDIKETVYYNFYIFSKKYFNINNKRILEVGCGYIPILSSIYKENNIDVDAINLKILFKNYKNVNTIEYDLNNDYNLSKYDIIVGIRPCNITENIIDLCYKYKKDFIIYLCPCIHKAKNGLTFATYEKWINYLKEKTSNFTNYNIIFTKYKKLPDKCPIIIGKYNNI